MFQNLFYPLNGGLVISTFDGRLVAFGSPEPEFLRRRYEHAQALEEIQHETRIRELVANESRGFVGRLRTALGFA